MLTGNWTLYDGLGRAVQRGALLGRPGSVLSFRQQPSGIYLLRVADERNGITHALRIEKQ